MTSTNATQSDPAQWSDAQTRERAGKLLCNTPWGRRVLRLLDDLQADRDDVARMTAEVDRMRHEMSRALSEKFRAETRLVAATEVGRAGSVCSSCGRVVFGAEPLPCGGCAR